MKRTWVLFLLMLSFVLGNAQTTQYFEVVLLRTNGTPLTGATAWLVPVANIYPNNRLALTAHPQKLGVYYRNAVPVGLYDIWVDQAHYNPPGATVVSGYVKNRDSVAIGGAGTIVTRNYYGFAADEVTTKLNPDSTISVTGQLPDSVFIGKDAPRQYPIWLPGDGRGITFEARHSTEINEGLMIFPSSVSNASTLTMLSQLGANGQLQWAARDTGGVYRWLAFMGHDLGNGPYPSDTYHKDGLPTVFVLHAYANAGTQGVSDHISIIRDTLTYSSGEKLFPGMTSVGATVPFFGFFSIKSTTGNYPGRNFGFPSSKAILNVVRGNSDSTNPFLLLGHGNQGAVDLEITHSARVNVSTKAGLINPFNGLGWRLNYWDSDSLRNQLNIQAGRFQTQISNDGTNIKSFYVSPSETYTNNYLRVENSAEANQLIIKQLKIDSLARIFVATKGGLINPLSGLGWMLNYWDSDSLRNQVNIQAGMFQTQISNDGTNIKYFYVSPYQTYTNNFLKVENAAEVRGITIGQNGSLIDSAKVVGDTLKFYVAGVAYKAVR
jgi:hypothetical protein